MVRYINLICCCCIFFSCNTKSDNKTFNIVKEWKGKEITFPRSPVFTILGKDTVWDYVDRIVEHKILTYIDSMGCFQCNLQLNGWKSFLLDIERRHLDCNVLFFIHSRTKRYVNFLLNNEKFDYPVCIDEQDSINILNLFPSEMQFQTFLLDKDNKVLAIGNPIHNPKIKELYLNIIEGKNREISVGNKLLTTTTISTTQLGMGAFSWGEARSKEFILTNTGKNPLVIEGVSTSCGCVTVDYTQEPIPVGKDAVIKVNYKAEQPEYFNKTITVYCNAKESPFRIKVTGNAK